MSQRFPPSGFRTPAAIPVPAVSLASCASPPSPPSPPAAGSSASGGQYLSGLCGQPKMTVQAAGPNMLAKNAFEEIAFSRPVSRTDLPALGNGAGGPPAGYPLRTRGVIAAQRN